MIRYNLFFFSNNINKKKLDRGNFLKKRAKRINEISVMLAEEAYKAYTGKKDYKRALEIYSMLATYECIPKNISNYSKNMMSRLGKKIEDNK